jgi:DNA repair protein RadA/Sms
MGETKTRFYCTDCGNETLKWEGRCPHCGEWNTLAEAPDEGRGDAAGRGRREDAPAGRAPAPLREAGTGERSRVPVELGEVDRVLGGGLVPGSLVLLGGAPGIGKSTLLLQLAARLLGEGAEVLYVSGEESASQVRLRAERLGGRATDVPFLAATDVEEVARRTRDAEPDLLCVDSVQSLQASRLDSAPGSVTQVRECAAHLQEAAKATGAATLLVGHVTKQGGLAGPRTLEHLVDAVLLFEGERTLQHRILRAAKNRFGGVDEMAVFRMTSAGLDPVADPSRLFLEDRPDGVSGSAVAVPLHGSRPLLAEVQGLTAPGRYGSPQRVSTGFPSRRLSLLLAVLERRAGLELGDSDVFVNVVGGLQLRDPAADLAVLAALASAHLERVVPADLAFVGEVGLGGEIRGVAQPGRRIREAARSGMATVVVPEGAGGADEGVELRGVSRVGQVVEMLGADG